jgi:hypothetical protein
MVLPLKVKHPDVWQRTDRKRKTTRMVPEYHYSKTHSFKHPLFLFFSVTSADEFDIVQVPSATQFYHQVHCSVPLVFDQFSLKTLAPFSPFQDIV